VVLAGSLTLTPGAGTVAWSGAAAPIQVVPDTLPPAEGGGAWTGEEDTTEFEVRNLTLHPGPAVVHWTGSRPTVLRELPPLRVRLPRFRRREPVPLPQPAPSSGSNRVPVLSHGPGRARTYRSTPTSRSATTSSFNAASKNSRRPGMKKRSCSPP
jgi:hypothetical protein